MLDALPLTPNGKLDRGALPAPDDERPTRGGYLPPRTPVEELLAGIWATVLQLERVGIGDNFFAIGGHSLLATQVVSRIRAAMGVELPLRALFEDPTIGGLAIRITDELLAASVSSEPVLTRLSREAYRMNETSGGRQ
jgi:hypothetical protein